MNAFFYGVSLQWKMDIRSRTLLLTCYLVPLLFFAVMGGIFTSVMPEAKETLIQSMTVFGVSMGALIGVPPSLVEIYGSKIRQVYKANGVPGWLGFFTTGLSAFVHLFCMSMILFFSAPLFFDAEFPEHPAAYVVSLVLFLVVTISVAGVIGLMVKDQSKTSMWSMLVFLPSILLSGILFPKELLPNVLQVIGNAFPAAWGYRLMIGAGEWTENFISLAVILILALLLCGIGIRRNKE